MITEITKYQKSFKTELLKFLIKIDYKFKNNFLSFIQNLLFNNKNILAAKKILIFRTGSIGDSVCAMPAINSIRKNFPDAIIDILTNAGSERLVSMGGLIDQSYFEEIIDYYGVSKKNLFNNLDKKNYDLVIELPQNFTSVYRELRNLFAFRSIGIKSAIGFEIGATRFFAAYQQILFVHTNERDQLLNVVKKSGLKDYGLNFLLGIKDETKKKIRSILKEKNIYNTNKNIAMVPGAKRQQNRWPIEYFKQVKDYLVQGGCNVLLIGGPADRELAGRLNGDRVYNFCGELTPLESAEMLKYCKVTISNDTGPMHLSYAVGTPVIAIFSGRDYPGKWYPPDDGKNIVVRNHLPQCVKCFKNECDNLCLKQIKPEQLIDKIKIATYEY